MTEWDAARAQGSKSRGATSLQAEAEGEQNAPKEAQEPIIDALKEAGHGLRIKRRLARIALAGMSGALYGRKIQKRGRCVVVVPSCGKRKGKRVVVKSAAKGEREPVDCLWAGQGGRASRVP